MQTYTSTTPFGRRSLTLVDVESQANAKTRPPDKTVNKWKIFRSLCAAKTRAGVSERALTVLDALLSFYPETNLGGRNLVVFPSNQQLALRAHGMAPATLRRHLGALVDSGLIIRRDSSNGKRFARKGQGGGIESAFGFDLSPLLARADEIEAWAQDVRAEDCALKLVRERITLCRRDIVKMIATGSAENVPVKMTEQGVSDWAGVTSLYRGLIDKIPRAGERFELEPIGDGLALLAGEIVILLENHVKTSKMSTNESQNERHIQSSDSENLLDLEPDRASEPIASRQTELDPPKPERKELPLAMVIDACPDIVDYARHGIARWRDLYVTAALVSAMLGISPSDWLAAQSTLGQIPAAIVVAGILQKGSGINSPGGYLRELTRKASRGEFSPLPMLMALIASRQRQKLAS